MKDLNILNLSNNRISDKEDIKIITNNEIPVSELSLKCNAIALNSSYRKYVFQNIPYLKKLDGQSMSEKDMEEDEETLLTKEMILKYTSNQTMGGSHSKTSNILLKTDILQNNLDTFDDSDACIESEILIINHCKIIQIHNLNFCPKLRKLSLGDNLIK